MAALRGNARIGSEYGEVSSVFGLVAHHPKLKFFVQHLPCCLSRHHAQACCVVQGFVEFRIGAQPLHLDVDTLNERLKVRGANRMRHTMHPDEAYGMIFSMDGVLINTRKLQHQAWEQVARQEGLELPRMQRQIYDIRPERAIIEVGSLEHNLLACIV